MTDINVDELREKAEKATPGPWVAGEPQLWGDNDTPQAAVLAGGSPITWDDHGGEVFDPVNAEFIAAANPQTVLSLLDEVERLRSTLLRIHGYVQGAVHREVPAFEDQYVAEYDASLFESLADAALDESTGIPFDADEDRAIVSTWIAEKARERREGEL